MPTVGANHAVSHNIGESRHGRLHAELTHCDPQFDAIISVQTDDLQ